MKQAIPHSEIARRVLREAAGWYSLLCAGEVSAKDNEAWQHWLAQGWEQQWAWSRIEHLQQQMQVAPPHMTREVLQAGNDAMQARRRALLKGLGAFGLVMPLAWVGWRAQSWQHMLADYSTATGERREWMLADGTRLVLNTDSAVNVSFNEHTRTVHLVKGEIYIETGHAEPQQRSLIVRTAQASLRPLGTQFMVRQHTASTWLGVKQHSVEVIPTSGQSVFELNAGQQVTLYAQGDVKRQSMTGQEASWVRGMLIITDWRLGDLVAELNRYRPGVLRCDPQLTNQRISGVFPLDRPEVVLEAIQTALPQVRVEYFTRYWVNLRPAA